MKASLKTSFLPLRGDLVGAVALPTLRAVFVPPSAVFGERSAVFADKIALTGGTILGRVGAVLMFVLGFAPPCGSALSNAGGAVPV